MVQKSFDRYKTANKDRICVVSELGIVGNITHEVPQVSILGPDLFNIYLNDIPHWRFEIVRG